MIKIKKSPTADTRTCDVSNVSKKQLYDSSIQHINDVARGMEFFIMLMKNAMLFHDHDKITGIDDFYSDFITNFEKTDWWENHKKVNRHHLQTDDGVPDDVNLIDVIEMIVDCVMAGMARSGKLYDITINDKILKKAFNNTMNLIKNNVVVEENTSVEKE